MREGRRPIIVVFTERSSGTMQAVVAPADDPGRAARACVDLFARGIIDMRVYEAREINLRELSLRLQAFAGRMIAEEQA